MARSIKFLAVPLILILPLVFSGAHPAQRSGSRVDNAVERARIDDDFAKALVLAQDNSASPVDFTKVVRASISGMLHTLDPHSMYFDPKQWDEFQNDQHSRYYGIGSTITQRNGKVYIWSPAEGTASYRAGLRYGDQIVGIDGESTTGWNSTQVRNKLIGPEGTRLTVKIARLGASAPLEFTLTRGAVPLPSVSNYFMLGHGTGYINLDRGFNTTTFDEVRRALNDLHQQGLNSLVLDLRLNHGGLVDQALQVSNIFLYRGQKILSMRGRPAVFPNREYNASNANPDDYPIVVLIGRETASAAEIVAGALQDHDRARLVGENSFGKGLVQNPFPLTDGSSLVLTTGHYYTPSGRLIQRDYSSRSFYDYYLKRGDKDADKRTDERHTDGGRPVFGGGGIDPDVPVKLVIPPGELELQRVWLDPVFEFVHALTAGEVSGFSEFKLDHPALHHHPLGATEFQPTDKMMAAFKTFMHNHKDLKADESRVEKDSAFIKRQIRYELVTAAYGLEAAYQVLLDRDNQVQRAVAEIPQAEAMANDIRRMHRTAQQNDYRKN